MSQSNRSPSNRLVIDVIISRFHAQKTMADKAVAQLSDPQLRLPLDENTNSVAVILKHMAGNLRSRFTDFLTSDGEKPDRNRDGEFIDNLPDRPAILAHWESGWATLFAAISSLTDADLDKKVAIRGQPHTIIEALLRALDHQAYHVGQIVQLARYLAKDKWTTLTVPRGGSAQFNQEMKRRFPDAKL